MYSPIRKIAIAAIVVFLLIALGGFVFLKFFKPAPQVVPPAPEVSPKHVVIGRSVEGRTIDAYTYTGKGTGEKKLIAFVGGMHGGYEWNSSLLAYQFMDYLDRNPAFIPDDITVTVIPAANPDGLFKIVGKEGRFTAADVSKEKETEIAGNGRFNARDVDLNRNFDCKWKPESTWRSQKVSAGTAAFSEPEAAAIRDFALTQKPSAVVFWHSQANAVYASECENGILPETLAVMNAYSGAAGYQAVQSFDAYPVSGDAEGWLASVGIPAITVELSTHENIEWEKNLAGTSALLTHFKLAK